MDQTFSDGLGGVTVIGNTVRLDFVTFSPTAKDATGKPQTVFSHRVVMDLDAFVRTAAKVQEGMDGLAKLVAASQSQLVQAEEAASVEKPAPAPASAPKPPTPKPFP